MPGSQNAGRSVLEFPGNNTGSNGHTAPIEDSPINHNVLTWRRAQWWTKLYSSDVKFFVIRTMAFFGGLCLLGGLVCAILGKPAPEFLVAGFSGCMGYLGGILTPSHDEEKKIR